MTNLQPPPPKFWHKYSPNNEFSISTAASGAIHVALVALFIFVVTRLMKPDEKTPVPIRGVVVKPELSIGGVMSDGGSGGGDPRVEAKDDPVHNPPRSLPEAELKKEIANASVWVPNLKDDPDAFKNIVQSPNFDKLKEIEDGLKKRIAQGFSGKAGTGKGMGSGDTGDPGKGGGGQGGPGDAASSGSRSMRWTIVFKTASGADYLKQLNEFKAKVVIPEPPNWKTNLLFEEIVRPNPGRPLRDEELSKMHFIDNDPVSAGKIARALGLKFDPPYFIAFFPKDVEEEMAAKERAYRNRKEADIFSTTFRVLEVAGAFEIRVTDQIPARK